MKRRLVFLGLLLVLVVANPIFAQQPVAEHPVGDVIVLCPRQQVPQAIIRAAQLLVSFTGSDDRIVIPSARIVNGDTLQITQIALDCTTDAATIASQIDRSPSLEINEVAPRPANEPGVAESQAGYLIVNTSAANLRSCDAATCTRVAVVDGGSSLVVLGRNGDDSWWFVQAGEYRGWIAGSLVIARGDLSDVPFVATQGERTPPTVYIGYPGNPIYNALMPGSAVICGVQGGREFALIGRNEDTTWLLIEAVCLDGTPATGWIDAQFVAIRNTGMVEVPVVR